ncbi:FAD:protein FMN transferase [Fonticella tunisiensis]|uniref:FAD:protein FMN transferase n=1 Tax=Fonticella tunisiensis TaxID=1096341 RepID=A0A4R7K4H7_9CLOT|nr:FAD:protein FMN transferase [Fonticella tunisiensis]TDT46056.1 thiamine biosynthesis lipoprotein [Fonticella tunisiensis]
MRRIVAGFLAVLLTVLFFAGCKKETKSEYTKYSGTFFDTFDTMTMVVAYTKSEQEFNYYFEKIHERFEQLHKLYDIYNDYEGINNIKTINDNAGIKPVKVDKEIIELILFAKDWYKRTGGVTNIAMGPVLSIWHDYREAGKDDPENAKLPPMEKLKNAAKYTDIDKVIVDTKNSTVYLSDKRMSLDVGAIAKGYATEIVAKEIMAEGLKSGIISAGGNVRVLGKPLDGVRERWGIGIQNPDKSIVSDDSNLDTVFLNNESVVTSGDYQRYYIVNGKVYHHLIDPKTLMPGEYYHSVTVVAQDSGVADFLSTTLFLLPYEKSRALVESLNGVEALWVMPDGKIEATDGMKKIMKSYGATGAKAE